MESMKLTVIGGGGVRSMFLAKSIARRSGDLGIKNLTFMDINQEKLRIFGGMAERVAQSLAPDLAFVKTVDPVSALEDADYVITTIRPGGDSLRVRDEMSALNLGVLGQETTGAAGFSFAMRSIPALVYYCELIKKYAKPSVKVFNFTNPAGLVSQALRDLGYSFTYGICDAPSGMLHQFAKLYGVAAERMSSQVYGLNHLSFFKSVTLGGEEIMDRIIADPEAYTQTDLRFFEPELVRHMGCIPNEYLYYFFYPEKALANIKGAGKTRGQAIEEINTGMIRELRGMDIPRDFEACLKVFEKWYGMRENSYMAGETGIRRNKPWTFDLKGENDGGYAGVALKFIEIARSGGRGSMILCVPNQGAIPGLDQGDVVEISCDITEAGHVPQPMGTIDPRHLELIRRVKAYEKLASQAIIQRDWALARDALWLHPLVNSCAIARDLVREYTAYNRPFFEGEALGTVQK
jgi:6-phospho-beta-glucosidase